MTNEGIKFIWDVVPLANWLISLILIIGFYGVFIFCVSKFIRRSYPVIFLSTTFVLTIFAYLFNLQSFLIIVSCFSTAVITIVLFANLGDLRTFISNPFKRTQAKANKITVEKIFDRQALYKTIESVVFNFSKNKIGAIITFEKNVSLDDIMKNGIAVHAPVSYELLSTIFYPGTRLHDGAVIIRDNEIVAASVFFTPTTKAYAEKYGSRHRAAVGVSEVTDSISVIVSEETGRISFAINGELSSVEPAHFLRTFENYMDPDSSRSSSDN